MSEDLHNDLSHNTYDGEARETLLNHGVSFMGFCERNEIHEDYISFSLFAFTFQGHALQWCVTFPAASIHFYDQTLGEFSHSFYHYDRKTLNKIILQLWKAPDESLLQF